MADQDVHIFSVHEPGTRSSSFVWLPVEVGQEQLTDDEILAAELRVQRFIHASRSKTAVVKYFTTAGKASITVMNEDDRFFEEQRYE
jgi:hypothetical protein